jgi:hypothetical protein
MGAPAEQREAGGTPRGTRHRHPPASVKTLLVPAASHRFIRPPPPRPAAPRGRLARWATHRLPGRTAHQRQGAFQPAGAFATHPHPLAEPHPSNEQSRLLESAVQCSLQESCREDGTVVRKVLTRGMNKYPRGKVLILEVLSGESTNSRRGSLRVVRPRLMC